MKAFRCRNCGRLEEAEHAGENLHPHACSVCGCGVSFDSRTGIKNFDASNWEVLADASPSRLTELGLTVEDVIRHVPPILTDPSAGRSVAAGRLRDRDAAYEFTTRRARERCRQRRQRQARAPIGSARAHHRGRHGQGAPRSENSRR